MTVKILNEIENIFYQQLVEWFETKASIFAENETFEEFYQYILEEYPEDFFPVKDLDKNNLLKLKPESALIINKDNYIAIKKLFEKVLNCDNEETFRIFLDGFENKTKDFFEEAKKSIKTTKIENWVILSKERIFHLKQRLKFFEEQKLQNQGKVSEFFLKLKDIRNNNDSSLNSIEKNSLNRFIDAIEYWMNIKLTSNQRKFIDFYIQRQLAFIHGYPGSSKTFTGMLAILLDALLKFKTNPSGNFINWLILAPTYEALKAAAENLYKFLEILVFKTNLLSDIKINLILPWSSENPKTDEILKNLSYRPIHNNYGKIIAKKYITEKLSVLKLSRRVFNEEKDFIFSFSKGKTLNVVLDLPIAFIRYGWGLPKNITDIEFHGIHIEEASQFSILDLLMVLIVNDGIFLNALEKELKTKEIYNKTKKFSFSGDPYQLASIFQIQDKMVKSKYVVPYSIYSVSF